MTLTTTAAAARLTREMDTAESTLAEAIVASTALLHTAAMASRDNAEAPSLQTQSALLHLGKLVSGLIEARGEALRVHGQLLEIGREMGATESPYCPPRNVIDTDQQRAA